MDESTTDSLHPVYHGFVKTEQDAILLLEAFGMGVVKPACQGPPHHQLPAPIQSGYVFMFKGDIQDWRDGITWDFLYTIGNFHIEHEQGSSDGLLRKIFSPNDGATHHLISYYTAVDAFNCRLYTPSQDGHLGVAMVRTELESKLPGWIPSHDFKQNALLIYLNLVGDPGSEIYQMLLTIDPQELFLENWNSQAYRHSLKWNAFTWRVDWEHLEAQALPWPKALWKKSSLTTFKRYVAAVEYDTARNGLWNLLPQPQVYRDHTRRQLPSLEESKNDEPLFIIGCHAVSVGPRSIKVLEDWTRSVPARNFYHALCTRALASTDGTELAFCLTALLAILEFHGHSHPEGEYQEEGTNFLAELDFLLHSSIFIGIDRVTLEKVMAALGRVLQGLENEKTAEILQLMASVTDIESSYDGLDVKLERIFKKQVESSLGFGRALMSELDAKP
ncbi:MAG: hypothetical protein Q9163_003851 [Psora crenata]